MALIAEKSCVITYQSKPCNGYCCANVNVCLNYVLSFDDLNTRNVSLDLHNCVL